MFEDQFYRRLTALRLEKGVSARDMSLSLGQSAGYINGLENKNGLPSMTTFFNICDYFKITPKDFFDEENSFPLVLNELIEKEKKLDKNELLAVENIVDILIEKKNNKY